MASHKRLKSVVQSTAHHAVGALSFVHPHLGRACEEAGLSSIEILLSETEPCPEIFLDVEPLRMALNCLRETFLELVVTEGFAQEDIDSAIIIFEFKHGRLDHYCSDCTLNVISASKTYSSKVNYLGNTEQNAVAIQP